MIKVAVVGAGHMGEGHLRVYSRKPGVKLLFVCDPDKIRGERVAQKYQTTWVADYREIIGQVDAASIVVPTNLHFAVASDFLKSGKPVLLEKPIAVTLREAKELVSLSQKKGVPLQIGHIERFNPAVQKLAERMKEPMYLEIHRLSPFKGRGTEVSVVSDLMIHDIDLVLELVGGEIRKIEALGLSVFTPTADIATSRLTFSNGVVANLTASRISDKSMRKVRIFEKDRYWSLDCELQQLYCYRKNPSDAWRKKERPTLTDLIVKEEVPVQKAEPLSLEIDAFLEVVRNKSVPLVTGKKALKALEVATKIETKIDQ